MFAVALFWPVEKAQESWVLPGEYVDERQHHGVNKKLKTMMSRSWFQIISLLSPRNLKIPIFDFFLFNDVETTTVWRYMSCLYLLFMFHCFFTTEESCRFLVGLKWVQIYLWEAALVLLLIHNNPVPCWGRFKYLGHFSFREILWYRLVQELFGQQVWKLEKLKLQENTCSLWNLIYVTLLHIVYKYMYVYCTYTIHMYIYIYKFIYLNNISIEFQIQKC